MSVTIVTPVTQVRKLKSGPGQRRPSRTWVLVSLALASGIPPVGPSPTERRAEGHSVAGRAQEVWVPPRPLPGCLIVGKSFNSPESAACSGQCERCSGGSLRTASDRMTEAPPRCQRLTVTVPMLRLAQPPLLRAAIRPELLTPVLFPPRLFSFLHSVPFKSRSGRGLPPGLSRNRPSWSGGSQAAEKGICGDTTHGRVLSPGFLSPASRITHGVEADRISPDH